MDILKNSVWEIKEFDGINCGRYRVIHIFDSIDCLILFPLENSNIVNRPQQFL